MKMDNPTLKPFAIADKTKRFFSAFEKKTRIPIPSTMGVVFFCMGLLCGRATLLGSLRPFGGAFFASVFTGRYSYLYMLAAVLGQVWSGAPLYATGKYIFAMTFFSLIIEKLPAASKKRVGIRSGIFAFSLAVSGLCFTFASSGGMAATTLYDLLLLFVECSAAFCSTAAFTIAVPIVRRMKLSYTFSSSEEISLVSLFGCVLWGAKSISNFGLINLSDVACIFLILVFSIRLGGSRGAVAGLVMGFVSSLGSGRIDLSCVSYAFSGLSAGLLGGFGAICGCAAFVLSNALITALANGSTEVLINIYDIICACILYSLIPQKVFLRITNFGARDEKDRIAEDERCYSEYVIGNSKRVVLSLGKRLDRIADSRKTKNDAEVRFFERIARRACSGCGMKRTCWGREIKLTMSQFGSCLKGFCETGKIKSELLPPNCLRPKEIREAFLQFSELYRNDIIWQGRFNELKKATHNNIGMFSDILSATTRSLNESQSFDRALADDILTRLTAQNISCRDVVVMRDNDYDPTVMLSLPPCGGFSLCDKGALEIVSAACGMKMVRAGKKDCRSCRIKYVAAPPTTISFATKKKARDRKKVSGDSTLVRVINKSLYAAVLTDGMGYGEKAYLEAKCAAETLLDLIEIGVDGESAMKIVNTVLLPFGEATFSAADLCLYDAEARKAQIIKCGGAASFSRSGDRVDTFYSKTMPLGSKNQGDVETFTLSARSGDIIVLISDGVLETSPKMAMKDTWLVHEIEKFAGNDPSQLADTICQKAMEKCAMTPKDDITVLAAYIN